MAVVLEADRQLVAKLIGKNDADEEWIAYWVTSGKVVDDIWHLKGWLDNASGHVAAYREQLQEGSRLVRAALAEFDPGNLRDHLNPRQRAALEAIDLHESSFK